MTGRVLDPEGRPLAGIPVYIALANSKGYVLPDQRFLAVDGPDAEGGHREARRFMSFTTTGSDGAYRVDAIHTRFISSFDGRVRAVPIHPAWMEPRLSPGEEGGDVRVEPAASLTVRVVDEHGEPIQDMAAIVREAARSPEPRLIRATGGGFVVQWRRHAGVPDEVRASILVWARGRSPESRTVTVASNRDADVLAIRLEPVRADGTIVLRPASPVESDTQTQLAVSLALLEARDDELLRVQMTSEGPAQPGTFHVTLPPGRFRLRASRTHPPQEGWVIDEEVVIPSGATVERTWAAPKPAAAR